MIYIETERLILRDWDASDIAPFCTMNKDEEVMRYFPNIMTDEASIALYNRIRTEFMEYGYGLYAVEERDTNMFIGFIGFHRATFEADFTPCVEIGWRLAKDAWGKGYATEGAMACLRYGFDQLGLEEVYSFTASINEPSKNVMSKIGMSFIDTFRHPNVEADSPLSEHVLFKIIKLP